MSHVVQGLGFRMTVIERSPPTIIVRAPTATGFDLSFDSRFRLGLTIAIDPLTWDVLLHEWSCHLCADEPGPHAENMDSEQNHLQVL